MKREPSPYDVALSTFFYDRDAIPVRYLSLVLPLIGGFTEHWREPWSARVAVAAFERPIGAHGYCCQNMQMGSKRAHAISNYIITITLKSRGRGPLTSSGWSRFLVLEVCHLPRPQSVRDAPFSRFLDRWQQRASTTRPSSPLLRQRFGHIASPPETRHSACEPPATLRPKDTFSALKLNKRVCYSGAAFFFFPFCLLLESDFPLTMCILCCLPGIFLAPDTM